MSRRQAALPLLLLSLVALMGMHCSGRQSLDDLAHAYCRIALALGERDPDALDFYIGPKHVAEAVHASYPTLVQTRRDTVTLIGQLEQFPARSAIDRERVRFMLAQLSAVGTRIEMLRGVRFDFDTEARRLFHVERLPDEDSTARRVAMERIDALLPAPHGHDLAARYAAYGQRFIIPRTKVPAVMQAALALCRQQTVQHIALPPEEKVSVQYVRNQPWDAFSRYRGHGESTIQINTDFPLTVDRALELACHEGYPGHHVFNTLWDMALAQKNAWPETQVQLTFSPQSFLSEAAAAYAPQLAFSPAERAKVEREVLFPLAGLPVDQADRYVAITQAVAQLDSALPAIAREYLDGRLEFVRAEQQLEAEALMSHSEATLLYLNEYRSYMLAYTDGRRAVAAYLESGSHNSEKSEAAWSHYRALIQNLVPPNHLFHGLPSTTVSSGK